MKQTIKSILAFAVLMLCGGAWAQNGDVISINVSQANNAKSGMDTYQLQDSESYTTLNGTIPGSAWNVINNTSGQTASGSATKLYRNGDVVTIPNLTVTTYAQGATNYGCNDTHGLTQSDASIATAYKYLGIYATVWDKTDTNANMGYLQLQNVPFAMYDVYVYFQSGTTGKSSGTFSTALPSVKISSGNSSYDTTKFYPVASNGELDTTTAYEESIGAFWGTRQSKTPQLGTNVMVVRGCMGTFKAEYKNQNFGVAAVEIVDATQMADVSFDVGGDKPTQAVPMTLTGDLALGATSAYDQTVGTRAAEVVKLNGANANTYNVFGGWSSANTTGTLNKDVWIYAASGYYHTLVGGSWCSWNGGTKKVTGNVVIQVDGDTTVDNIVGADYQDAGTPTLTGNVNIILKDRAVVKGGVIGGGVVSHTGTVKLSGSSTITIKNIQSENASDGVKIQTDNTDYTGYIAAGGSYGWNRDGVSEVVGDTSVVVDIASGSGDFVKNLVGGGLLPNGGGSRSNPVAKVTGNSSVTISAPSTVNFTGTIVAGGYKTNDESGTTPVTGTATLTINGGTFSQATLKGGTATGDKTLVIGGDVTLGAGSISGFNKMAVNTGKTLSLSVAGSNDVSFTPVISGEGAIDKVGTGTLRIAAGNEGLFTVKGGTLSIGLSTAQQTQEYTTPAAISGGSVVFHDLESGTALANGSTEAGKYAPPNNAWTGGATGSWDVAGNWSRNAIPNEFDFVDITSAATITLTSESKAREVRISANVTFTSADEGGTFGSVVISDGSRMTVDANSKITIGGGTLDVSKVTNNGVIKFVGGTTEAPIVVKNNTEDALKSVEIGVDSCVKYDLSGSDSRTINVTGVGATSSTLIIYTDHDIGLLDTSKIRNCKVVLQSDDGSRYFWWERGTSYRDRTDGKFELLDKSCDLVIETPVKTNDSTEFEIGAISGSKSIERHNPQGTTTTIHLYLDRDGEYTGNGGAATVFDVAGDHDWKLTSSSFANTITGNGRIRYSKPSLVSAAVKTALRDGENWTGTLVIEGTIQDAVSSTKTTLNDFGSVESAIEFANNAGTYIGLSHDNTAPIVIQPKLVIAGTLNLSDGYSHDNSHLNNYTIIRKLAGEGTISCSNATQLFYILDGTGFSGTINSTTKKFVFGERDADNDASIGSGEIVIRSTAAAPAIARDWGVNKVTIENGQSLTVSGNRTTQGIYGKGTLINSNGKITAKNLSGGYAVNGATIQIDGGEFCLNLGTNGGFSTAAGDPTINDATFVIKSGSLTNNGYVNMVGTITYSNDSDKSVFGSCFRGSPNFVKEGAGTLTYNMDSSDSAKIASLKVNGGAIKIKKSVTVDSYSTDEENMFVELDDSDATWNVYTLRAYVAKIGDEYYASIDDAITAADDGAVIEILADIPSSGGNISTSKDLTICVPTGASRTISRYFRTGCNFTKTGAGELTANITINSGKALNVNEGTLNLTTESQGVKGTLNVAAGAVFNNSTTDMFTYSTAGAVANIRGTVNLGTSRWTVQGNIVTLNVYAGATITGTRQTPTGTGLSMDLFKNSIVNFLKNGDVGGDVNWQVETRLRENSAQTFEFNIAEGVTVKVSKIITDCDNSAAANFTSMDHILKKTGAGTLEFVEGSQLDATFVEANAGTVKYTAGTFGDIHSKTNISGESALVVSTSELAAGKIVPDASGKVLGVSKAGSVFTYSLWDATNPPAPIVVPEGTTEVQLVPGQTATYEGETAPKTVKIVVPNVSGSGSFDITEHFTITTADGTIAATLKDDAKPATTAIAMAAPTEGGTDKVAFTITNPIAGLFYAVSTCDEPNGDFTSATGDQATSSAAKTVSIPMEFSTGKKVKYYKVSVKATK